MGDFANGVASSIVASALLAAAAWFQRARLRRLAVRLLGRLTGVGALRTYRTQAQANADLAGDLARARWVKVVTGRGNELTRDSFRTVWDRHGRIESVQILLPDPEARKGSWLEMREAELRKMDPGFSAGLLADQVRANITYLVSATAGDDRCEIRLLDLPQASRLVVTDQVLYLTVYDATAHGRNSPCLVFGAGTDMYSYGLHLFDLLWRRADAVRTAVAVDPTT